MSWCWDGATDVEADTFKGGGHGGSLLQHLDVNKDDDILASLRLVGDSESDAKLDDVLAASNLKDRLAAVAATPAPPPAESLSAHGQNLKKVFGNNRWG